MEERSVRRIDGSVLHLGSYVGLPLLIVNTACDGPFSDQFGGLQVLFEQFAPLGLEVLAFPSNDFGHEPREGAALVRTVERRYGVTFTVCEKCHVTGPQAHPLWRELTTTGPERVRGPITHDFTKFLVDPDGDVVERLGPEVGPLDPRLALRLQEALPTITSG